MPSKLFGQYLLERSVITPKILVEVMAYQREIIQPLCKVAVEQGYSAEQELAALSFSDDAALEQDLQDLGLDLGAGRKPAGDWELELELGIGR